MSWGECRGNTRRGRVRTPASGRCPSRTSAFERRPPSMHQRARVRSADSRAPESSEPTRRLERRWRPTRPLRSGPTRRCDRQRAPRASSRRTAPTLCSSQRASDSRQWPLERIAKTTLESPLPRAGSKLWWSLPTPAPASLRATNSARAARIASLRRAARGIFERLQTRLLVGGQELVHLIARETNVLVQLRPCLAERVPARDDGRDGIRRWRWWRGGWGARIVGVRQLHSRRAPRVGWPAAR